MKAYGIKNEELEWFVSYLFYRSQVVDINNIRSNEFYIYSGVPQGSILGPLLFLLFFNDFPEVLKKSKVLMYADDTVIYYAHSNINFIENVLNEEMNYLSRYFYQNELILNLKKGKTEAMVFGTAKRLSTTSKFLSIKYNGNVINNATTYKYLGNHLDRNLNLDENFERAYRKASGRLHLLAKLRCQLTTLAAMKIFDMVIIPLLTYSSIISLKLTRAQSEKLLSLERRASRIIGKKVNSIECTIKKRAINMVHNVLTNNDVCENFNDYFAINYHAKNTRNRNTLLKLPRVKLEFTKRSFKYMGAKLYNDLPLNIRACENDQNFKKLFNEYVF